MRLAVGLPDLHPGRGHPVGAAFVTEGVFYPQLVGNDIGCGMGFWQSDLKRQKFRQDKCVKKLDGPVICEDKDLPYEEAPQAYKDIDIMIKDMVQAGLITIVATRKPLITYKFRRSA